MRRRNEKCVIFSRLHVDRITFFFFFSIFFLYFFFHIVVEEEAQALIYMISTTCQFYFVHVSSSFYFSSNALVYFNDILGNGIVYTLYERKMRIVSGFSMSNAFPFIVLIIIYSFGPDTKFSVFFFFLSS